MATKKTSAAKRKGAPDNPGTSAFKRCVEKVAKRPGVRSPGGVCRAAAVKKYGEKKLKKMAATGRKRAAKTRGNPEGAAAERYEFFHGQPPDVVVDVETPIHEHSVLSGIGKLVRLVILAVDGRTVVTLEGFKGALLAQNEKGTQLFIEGGNQAVNLKDFGIVKQHEREFLGAVQDIVYHTVKVHLRPEDGGKANYDHQFGKRSNGDDKHVPIAGGRLPIAVYHVRDRLIHLVGGTYDLPEVGIRG